MSRNGSYLSADMSRVLEEYGFEENDVDDDVTTTGSDNTSEDPETSGAGAESEEVFDGEFTLADNSKLFVRYLLH